MESEIVNKLKKLSKDPDAFEQLKNLYTKLDREKHKYKKHVELLESAIENDYDSILITEIELEKPGPKIVYVNDGFCKMTGYSKDEVLGKTPRILQGPKTDRAVLDKLKRRLGQGKSFFGKAVNYRKDGSEFINQWDIHPLTDEEENITHWVSYQHDITERKRAEEMLVDTKMEFDELREELSRTILDVDLQGNIIFANKSFRKLIGYGKSELKDVKIWDFFPKKYRDSLEYRFEDGADADQFKNRHFRGLIRHKSGIPIQIEGNTNLLKLKGQTLIRADIKNITLRKKIMKTLRKRNRDYSRIVEKASEFTYCFGMTNGRIIVEYVSKEFPRLTGLTADEVQEQKGIEKFVHEDDLEKVRKHFENINEGKECTCEYRIRKKEGGYMDVIDYGRPEWDDLHQKVICARGSVVKKKE